MVNCASLADVDNDGAKELVFAGEWMPIQYLKLKDGQYNLKVLAGENNASGWWQSFLFYDLDGDGDEDFIAGNWGMNSYRSDKQVKQADLNCVRRYWYLYMSLVILYIPERKQINEK